MFISVLELFKIGIGPSSSHTVGPMVAAHDFVGRVREFLAQKPGAQAAQMAELRLRCTLKGSLAYTGKGHASERAVTLGLHGYLPDALVEEDIDALVTRLAEARQVELTENKTARFRSTHDIIFDLEAPLPEHPNGLVFELLDSQGTTQFSKTYF
ncbi:MAG: L-serine ammonia-lyase, partial [Planctomycetes bacterium]|nr:L-serine ammonia-lyase [Planctomycetota bacterium]